MNPENNSCNGRAVICGLAPYTVYDVGVDCRNREPTRNGQDFGRDLEYGHWSDINVVSVLTGENSEFFLNFTVFFHVQSNLFSGATQGKEKKWLLKTGDPLIRVYLHCILAPGTQKRWVLKTGDPLIEVTT